MAEKAPIPSDELISNRIAQYQTYKHKISWDEAIRDYYHEYYTNRTPGYVVEEIADKVFLAMSMGLDKNHARLVAREIASMFPTEETLPNSGAVRRNRMRKAIKEFPTESRIKEILEGNRVHVEIGGGEYQVIYASDEELDNLAQTIIKG